ncbi:hypothetical protein Efla_005833 [Eimeria flavescens]
MSRKVSSRSSSSMFVTPRSSSLEDMETGGAGRSRFQRGANMQRAAPDSQAQQQRERWVDQQQWEEEQRLREQQLQQQQQQGQHWQQDGESAYQQQQNLFRPPVDLTGNTEALTQAVMEQLQQNPVAHEDLNRMVGEGQWQQPTGTAWNYSKANSLYNGFSSRAMEKGASGLPLEQSQMSGVQMQNSGIYVPGLQYWNAVTNMPVDPMGQEAPPILSRKFTKDVHTGEYVNAHDPSDRVSAEALEKLNAAMSQAAVEETIVDVMKRRSTLRKMQTTSRIFARVQKKERFALSETPPLPSVMMTYLPDRYIKTYERKNCLGQRVSARQHKCICSL